MYNDKDNPISNLLPKSALPAIFLAIVVILLIASFSTFYVVSPGHRGVLVTLGSVSSDFKQEGLGFKMPLISSIIQIPVKQITSETKADCYSSDLQQITIVLAALYRIPEASVVTLYRQYAGNAFQALIDPRIQEAVKEAVALENAESVVKKRDLIKTKALELARKKIGTILVLEDLVIRDINLSKELEAAIEQKMVQEQEAAKAKFTQQKAEIEAKTAIIRATGEAEAIRIRGQSIRENPAVIDLQMVEKWNGITPLVVGNSQGANILLPIKESKR
ncbi:MAG: prohibitin family protein [Verrucomicrobiae bacterium]|nr:prohibitin family protein [Verrucomicrobiae bacterium]